MSDVNKSKELVFLNCFLRMETKPLVLMHCILIFLNHVLPSLLYLLTKQSLSSLTLPDLWKKAHVTPSTLQPSNYRPISLTSQVLKRIKTIVRKQLWDFPDKHKVLSMAWLVKQKSCFTNLLECHSKWVRHSWFWSQCWCHLFRLLKSLWLYPILWLISKLQSYGVNSNLLM